MENNGLVKKILLYIFFGLIAIAVSVYMIYHVIKLFSTEMIVETVEAAELSDTVNVTGVIFRDETVLYGTRYGSLDRLFADGERVAKDTPVVRIYDKAAGSDKELSLIDRQLSILNDSGSVSDNSTKAVDAEINRLYYALRQKAEDGDYGGVTSKLDRLLVNFNRREIITNARVNFNAEIASLRERREGIVRNNGTPAETVYTNVSGYFMYDVDGYERIMTAKALKGVSYGELKGLLDSSAEQLDSTSYGYAVGKIAASAEWYLCAELDPKTAMNLVEGREYGVSFSLTPDQEIRLTLDKILSGAESSVIIMSSTVMPKDFNNSRKQTVQIKTESVTGLRVPASAVRVNEEGEQGVFILKNNRTTFRYIDVIDSIEGYYIVREFSPEDEDYAKYLHRNDVLIVRGKNLREQINLPEEESTEYRIRIFD